MNWFACYLAISCCNKFSIFFDFIRKPGQNVRCHKFGEPCTSYIADYASLGYIEIFQKRTNGVFTEK